MVKDQFIHKLGEHKDPVPMCTVNGDRLNLKQAFDLTFVIQVNVMGAGVNRQSRHGHDITTNHHQKLCSRGQPYLPYGHNMVFGRTE